MNGLVVGLGVILVIGAVFLIVYSVAESETVFGITLITKVEYPYQTYGFALAFFGIVSLFMGFVLPSKTASYEPLA